MNIFGRALLVTSALIFMGLSRACCNTCCDTCCDSSCNSCCDNNCCDSCGCQGGDFTNKTFFSDPVMPFASATPWYAQGFRREIMSAREEGCGGGIQVAVFGGRTSGKGSEKLGRWFGLNYKNTLKVSNIPQADSNENILEDGADIDANHFNIRLANDAHFNSTIKFCPKQVFAGVGLSWRQIICRNDDDTARWWFELTTPLTYIKNDMRFSEEITLGKDVDAYSGNGLDDSPFVNSMAKALNQKSWKYGKITPCCTTTVPAGTTTSCNSCCDSCCDSSCCSTSCCDDCCCDMKRTRLAEIEFKIGHNWVSSPCCSIDNHVGLIFPTGNRPCGRYVFEAVVGTGHFGLSWGSEINFKLYTWEDCDAAVYYRAAADGRYMFSKNETRSFDLVGKPWSRYMAMFKDQAQMEAQAASQTNAWIGTSGINLLTQCVKVTPRAYFNFNTGLAYEGECYMAEGGWTIYARQAEEVCPCWKEGPALKGTGDDVNVLTKARTIRDRFTQADLSTAFYDRLKIKTCDIDWNSGAHPASISYSFYGALGYKWGEACYPTMVSVGGGYDFGHSNTAIHRWTLFGKLGVSF